MSTSDEPPPPATPEALDDIEDGTPPAALSGATMEKAPEYFENEALQIEHGASKWETTMRKVVSAVVSLHYRRPFAFDNQGAGTSQATGFVVDAERGFILTNRHVVGPGPFRGYGIFDNHEEVDVYPVYRDPVHDFGFLKFDPKAIRHMEVTSLELHPERARVGVEIRVVGNDAGEKLSILAGFISRLDRGAPLYGSGYCDFNTSYYQASAAASGGSSGSPVVDIHGAVLALNAGGKRGAAMGFMLPLHDPLRALRCLQEGRPVLRGDIQCRFALKPFDECKRLGLAPEREAEVRRAFPKGANMLVANRIVPEGPAQGEIEEGDILIEMNGELVTQFASLEGVLNSSVGSNIELLFCRGGEDVKVSIEVHDLHKITPSRFLSVAGAVFHEVSYQQAQRYTVPCRGVFVSRAEGSFGSISGSHCVIESIDDCKVRDLDAFIEKMKEIPDRARVVVTYKSLTDIHTIKNAYVYLDRHWSGKMELGVRNDETGTWDFANVAGPPLSVSLARQSATFVRLQHVPHPVLADLVRSFVGVECQCKDDVMPGGLPQGSKHGMGLVVDADQGLVVISRAIVPHNLCDITVTIASSILVEGKVVFLHPAHNYVVIQYDPALVDAPVLSAKLSTEEVGPGAPVYFIGYRTLGDFVHASTTISRKYPFVAHTSTRGPWHRAMNIDVLSIDSRLGEQCGSGVLAGSDGTIQALWLSFVCEKSGGKYKGRHRGLETALLTPVLERIRAGNIPQLRVLPAEFTSVKPFEARLLGVSEQWIKEVTAASPSRHRLFKVERSYQVGTQERFLLEGDVLLKLNDRLVTNFTDLDPMYFEEVLDAVIVRGRKEIHLKPSTLAVNDVSTNHIVTFCGATIHQPELAVRQVLGKLYSEIYVSFYKFGSPADQYKLYPAKFITHVEGQPTRDVASFLAAVIKIEDNKYFRLKLTSLNGAREVVTMKKDVHYFPTIEWTRDSTQPLGWRCATLEGRGSAFGEATCASVAA